MATSDEDVEQARHVGELERLEKQLALAMLAERVRRQAASNGAENGAELARLSEPSAPATTNAAWPRPTHDEIVKQAFDRGAFPGLSERELEIIKRGSREVDCKYGVPITLFEGNAPQHAMTPGAQVREYIRSGLSPEEAVRAAQAWARQETAKWIAAKKREAQELLRRGDRDGALRVFGQAMHPVMDNVSPAHRDYQVYNLGQYLEMSPEKALVLFARDMWDHTKTESRLPTDEEKKLMIEEMGKHFGEVFGELHPNGSRRLFPLRRRLGEILGATKALPRAERK